MINKKNLPNIPIYPGDWQRDLSVVSLKTEAAWLHIIFKLWTNGKQNSIKIDAKSLQNLWRCTEVEMFEIIEDLMNNDIGIIEILSEKTFNKVTKREVSQDFYKFTCRRFVKENSLSEIRSNAAKGKKTPSKKETNLKQNSSKHINKNKQNTENEIENENEIVIESNNEIEIENFEKSEKLLKNENIESLNNLKIFFKNEKSWKETVCRNLKEVIPKFSLTDVENYLDQFFKQIENDGEEFKTVKATKKHFSRWLNLEINKNHGNKTTRNTAKQQGASNNLRKKTAERLGIIQPE